MLQQNVRVQAVRLDRIELAERRAVIDAAVRAAEGSARRSAECRFSDPHNGEFIANLRIEHIND